MIEPLSIPTTWPRFEPRPQVEAETLRPTECRKETELRNQPAPPAPECREETELRQRVGPPQCADASDTSDLLALGHRIALLSAQIQAATYQLLVMIREFDERQGWFSGGGGNDFRSCAHWLNWRTGLDLGAAREKVRVARALGELPLISDEMRRGEISYSKVRALTRVATPKNEQELLEFARAGTASHVEKLVRAWRRLDRYEELEKEEKRRASRELQIYTDEDGMVVVKARLEPEAGAALLKALEAGEQVLFAQGSSDGGGDGGDGSAGQRRADALGLVAESALSHGIGASPRGDRLQVVVHVDQAVLEDSDAPGVSMLEEGQDVSAETSRRLACDSTRVVMRHDAEGRTLGVGRKTRTISTSLRRALAHRDRECQFPGCDLKYCDAHHVKHWAEGGETNLDNLVLLCRRHHRAVHEGGYRLERSGRSPTAGAGWRFFRPDGGEIVAAPPMPEVTDLRPEIENRDTELLDAVLSDNQNPLEKNDLGRLVAELQDRSEIDDLGRLVAELQDRSEIDDLGRLVNQLWDRLESELLGQDLAGDPTIGPMTGFPRWEGERWDLDTTVAGLRAGSQMIDFDGGVGRGDEAELGRGVGLDN